MAFVASTMLCLFSLLAACSDGGDQPTAAGGQAEEADAVAETSTPATSSQSSSQSASQPSMGTPLSGDGWQPLPELLSARSNALGVWTGSEVLVIGGDPEAWCPPNADCTAPDFDQLQDGGAYDPAANQWRPIAEAPQPIGQWAATALVGDDLYIQTHPIFTDDGLRPAGFLSYDVADDRWVEHPPPIEDDDHWYQLASVGEAVVAYNPSDENGEQPDRLFDPETATWRDLPPDPLSPSFDRLLLGTGDGRLLLLAKDIVANPGSDGPSLSRLARLDLATERWEVIDDAEILGTWEGIRLGRQVVFPWPGEADGGQVNNWGRSYPSGGTYHLDTGQWTELPEPARSDGYRIAGVVTADEGFFHSAVGSVLDLDRQLWIDLPPLPEDQSELVGRTVVSMGRGVFVFGGEDWTDGTGRQTPAAFALIVNR